MIKNSLYPYIEKYINEYLLGFSKEQLNIGLTNGSIVLEKLFIRPDTTNEKLNSFDIPIWLKLGTIKNIQIGCSLMNFLGDNPLEVEINDVEIIVCPSFKYVVKNLNSFIIEKEMHFREAYDPVDNNSHEVFGQKVNLFDSSMNKPKEQLFKIFNENVDNSKLAQIFNKIYTKALKFYYQKNYLIKIKVKNTSLRFEDDHFNYFGKSVVGVRIPYFEVNLSVDGILKKNNFKIDNLIVYYEKEPKILIPSKFFLSNLNQEGKLDVNKYFENLKSEKLISDKDKEVILLNNFNCMGNFGIKSIESEKVDFFAKNTSKKYNFFIQIATNEVQLNLYPEVLNKIGSFEKFVRSFYVNELIQYFKPMRKPYSKSNEYLKFLSKDQRIIRKRKLVVRDWFNYMIWFTRIKKVVYGTYYKNALQEEFTRYYNLAFANTNHENELDNAKINMSNVNDSIDLRKDIKKEMKKDIAVEEAINPDKISMVVDNETLIKGVNLQIFGDKDSNFSIKVNGVKNSIKIDKDTGTWVFSFKDLAIIPSKKVLIDKSIDDKIYLKVDNSSSNASTEACSNTNDDDSDSRSKNNLIMKVSSSKVLPKANYNSNDNYFNPKLMLLNEALEQLGANESKTKNSSEFIKNKTNSLRNGNVLKEILGNIPNEEEKKQINKEKKNKDFSQMINEFNKSFIKKSNNIQSASNKAFSKNSENKVLNYNQSNPVLINEKSKGKIILNGEKVPLNLFEIHNSDILPQAFSFTFSKKNESHKVSDTLATNTGFIRVNHIEEYFTKFLEAIIPYKTVIQSASNRLKNTLKIDFENQQELLQMRKQMIERLADEKDSSSDDMRDFYKFLKDNIEIAEKSNRDGNYVVNYASSILEKKSFDLSLQIADITMLGFDLKGSEEVSSANRNNSKLKLPKMNFKLKASKEKIFAKVSELEFSHHNPDNFAIVINNLISMISDNFSSKLALITPVIKPLQAEFERLEKERIEKEKKEVERKRSKGNDDIPYLMNIISSNINNRNGSVNHFEAKTKEGANILSSKESIKTNKQVILKNLIENNIATSHVKKVSHHSFKSSIISELEAHSEIPVPSINEKQPKVIQKKMKPNNFDDSDHLKSPNSIHCDDNTSENAKPQILKDL